MYKAAADQLEAIPAHGPEFDSVDYYNCYLKLYHTMAQTAMAGPLRREYRRLKGLYRDSVLLVVDRNRLTCTLMRHDKRYEEGGDPQESIRELNAFFSRNDNSTPNKAVIANSLADAYGRLGDDEQRLRYLTLTAIYDLEVPSLAYSALPRLADLLFRRGDLVRANRYITRSLDDAIDCNSVNRILIASRTMTEINQSFMQEIARHQHRLYLLLAVVTGTILLLTGILVFTLRQKRTIKQLQTQHANDNERLRELNERLSVINRQQETINDELSKANTVKDKYIRHYMQLSTLYINKLERFRVQLFKTFNTHGWTAFCANCAPPPPPNGNTRPSSTSSTPFSSRSTPTSSNRSTRCCMKRSGSNPPNSTPNSGCWPSSGSASPTMRRSHNSCTSRSTRSTPTATGCETPRRSLRRSSKSEYWKSGNRSDGSRPVPIHTQFI